MTDIDLMLTKANHVEAERYPSEVEERIKALTADGMRKYPTSGSEIAILRKAIKALADALGVALPQEFLDYYAEIESAKAEARQILEVSNG